MNVYAILAAILGFLGIRSGQVIRNPAADILSGNPTPYDYIFTAEGRNHGVNPNLIKMIAFTEHGFIDALGRNVYGELAETAKQENRKNGVIQSTDIGVMQINDIQGKHMGIEPAELYRASVNIATGARLLASLKRELSDSLTLDRVVAAYNAGSPTIKRAGIINPEYVAKFREVKDTLAPNLTDKDLLT